jgi:antitoxin HicB
MATRTLTYTVHIEPAEEGGYVVTVPALGCTTQGETYEEAMAMAQDCIEGWLEMLAERGERIPIEPEPTEPTDVLLRVSTSVAA